MNKLILLLLVFITFSCKTDTPKMGIGEQHLANKILAERVAFSHKEVKTTTNGRQTSYRQYLHVEIFNPKELISGFNNDSFLNKKCRRIATYLMDLVSWEEELVFSELQIDIINEPSNIFSGRKKTKNFIFKFDSKDKISP